MATRSIDILINAKDRASSVFGSVGTSLKRLVGNVFSLNGMLTGALGALGVSLTVKSFLDAAEESAAASAKLNSVLASTGGVVGITSAELQKMAGDLQRVTRFSDDTIVSSEAVLATFTRVRGDVFKDAIKSALDLSTVMGTDLQSATMQIGKALNDPVQGMTALRRAGVSFTAAQRDQIKALQESGDLLGAQRIILSELKTEFGGAAVAAGKTFGGQITILKNQVSDLWESIGFGIGDTIMSIWPNLSASIGDVSNRVFSFAESVVRGFTVAQQQWGLWSMQIDFAILGIVGLRDRFVWLMGTIRDLLQWFGRNWKDVFVDAFNVAETIAKNLARNLINLIIHTPEMVAGKMSADELWTPLTEGFTSSLKELPKIAEFQLSPLAEQMALDVGQRMRELSDEETEKLADERIARMRAFRDERAGKNIKPKPAAFDPLAMAFGVGGVPGLIGQLVRETGITPAAVGAKVQSAIAGVSDPLATILGGLVGAAPGGPTKAAAAAIKESRSGTASLEESRFLTGVAQASRERDPNASVVKELREDRKISQKTHDAIVDLARAIQQGSGLPPGIFSGR